MTRNKAKSMSTRHLHDRRQRQRLHDPARGTEVVRRQADGTWRFVIDNPTGTA